MNQAPLTVLIVEDDPHVLLGCQQALALEDIACEGVGSATRRIGINVVVVRHGLAVQHLRIVEKGGRVKIEVVVDLVAEYPEGSFLKRAYDQHGEALGASFCFGDEHLFGGGFKPLGLAEAGLEADLDAQVRPFHRQPLGQQAGGLLALVVVGIAQRASAFGHSVEA